MLLIRGVQFGRGFTLMSVAVFVTAIFLFVNVPQIQAADDNLNEPMCDGVLTYVQPGPFTSIFGYPVNAADTINTCDNTQTMCETDYGFNWTSQGYPGGAGNASCCGDDSNESYVVTSCQGGAVSVCCSPSSPSWDEDTGTCVSVCPNVLTVLTPSNWSTDARFYQDISYEYIARNDGGSSATFDIQLQIKEGTGSWQTKDSTTISNLATGNTTSGSLTWSAPRNCSSYWVRMVYDPNNDYDGPQYYPSSSGDAINELNCTCSSVSNLQATNITSNSITWTWSGGSCANEHIVESTSPVGTEAVFNTTSGSYTQTTTGYNSVCDPHTDISGCVTSVQNKNLEPGEQVCVYVQSANFSASKSNGFDKSDFIGPDSGTVCATTLAPSCGDNTIGSEQDFNQSLCSGGWGLTSGDSTSLCWDGTGANSPLCCGDDTSEYVASCTAGAGANCGTNNPELCSNSPDECYFDGVIASGDLDTADASSDIEHCERGVLGATWCDADQIGCDVGFSAGNKFCWNSVGSDAWIDSVSSCKNAGPGNICDDADGGGFCCGDDPNENLVTNSCQGGSVSICCPDSAPFYNEESGSCVASCSLCDLTITKIQLSGSQTCSESQDVWVTVYNSGSDWCLNSQGITVDSSVCSSFTGDPVIGGIPPDASNTYSCSGWVPATGGNYTISANVSYGGVEYDVNNNSSSDNFTISCNQVPNTPTNSSPSNGEFVNDTTPLLSASAFSDPDAGDTHGASQWQVCSDSGCTSVVWDSGTDVASTSKTVPTSANLADNTTYYWKVRYQDNNSEWSNYSNTTSFSIDVTDPVCGTESYSPVLSVCTSGSVDVTMPCTDSGSGASGCVSNSYTTTRTDNGSGNFTIADVAGNSTTLNCEYNVTNIDATSPSINTVTSSSPACDTVRFTIDASDNGTGVCGLASSAYSFDNAASWQSNNYRDYSGTNVTINQNGVDIKVKDTAGNITTYTSSVNGTSSSCLPPSFGFSPSSLSWTNNPGNVNMTVTDSDGISECRYKWDNSSVGSGNGSVCNEGTNSISMSSLSNGSHTLYTWAIDTSGLSASSNAGIYYIDKAEPSVDNLGLTPGGARPTISWTVSDTGGSNLDFVQVWRAPGTCASPGTWANVSGNINQSGTNSSGVWQEPSNIADGTYCYGLHVNDIAGNYGDENSAQSAATSQQVTIDTTPPPAPTCSPESSTFLNSITVTCSDSEGGTTIRYTTSGIDPNTSDTVYSSALTFIDTTTLKVRAWDSAGNASATNTYTYTENFLPNTSIDSNPSDPSSDTTPTFTFSGTQNPTSFECKIDSGVWTTCTSPYTPTVSAGSRTFEVRAINTAGTDPSPASYTWTVDTTGPTCASTTYSPLLSTWTNGSTTVTVTCSDASGCQQTTVQQVVSSNGSGNITITDGVGNTTQCPYNVTNIDSTGPSISSVTTSSPACETVRFTVSASDADSGLHSTAYSFDGGLIFQSSNNKDFNGTNVTLNVGDIKVQDATGNVSTYGSSVNGVASVCDTSAPDISFNPTNTSWTNNASSALTLTITDSGTISDCRYKWDNATVGAGDGIVCNQGDNNIVWGVLANGSHTIYVWTSDTENNTRTANSGPYQIDVAAPSVDTLGLTASGSNPILDWQVTDTGGSNLDFVQVWRAPGTCASPGTWVNASGDINQSGESSTGTWTETTSLADGTYCYGLHVNDIAGNYGDENSAQSAATSQQVTIDTTPPPAPTCIPTSQSFLTSIDVNCSNSESGTTIRYTTNGTTPGTGSAIYSGTLTFTNSTTLNVRAWDSAGNASETNTYNYSQGNLPNTTIDSNPSDPSSDTTPTFTFSGTNTPTGFECRIDASTWANCTSPYTPTVNAGSHTFEVRALNTFGADGTPASYSWTVDLTGPTCETATYSPNTCVNSDVTASVECTIANDPAGCTQLTYSAIESVNASGNITVTDTLGNNSSCPYTVDKIDKNGPVFDVLTVEGQTVGGSTTITTSGNKPTMVWNTSTAGCATFTQVELWRTDYDASTCNGTTMSGCSWTSIWSDIFADSSQDDTTAANVGDYWYGMHAIDSVGNCTLENNVACGGTGNPVRVTMAIPDPNFTIDLSPNSRTITQGTDTTYDIVINPSNGFSSSVGSWSIQNCPGTATCSVTPASCTSDTYSTCATLTIGSTGGLNGTYSNISVQGTGNGLTNTSNSVDVTVNPVPGYSITLSPSSRTVTQGSSANYDVSINASGGFNSTVSSWTIQSCPGGASNCSLTFSSCDAVSYSNCGQLQISTGSLSGAYSGFSVRGTGGGDTQTSNTASLTVNTSTDYSLSLSPSSRSIAPGDSTTYDLVVSPSGGFSASVGSWFVSNCPSGASCTVAPSSCASGAYNTCATLTISNTSSLNGTFTGIRVQGTGDSITHDSNTVTLDVSTAPDFTISLSPSSQTVAQGSNADYNISISASGGFSSDVGTWTVQGCPSGASCTVAPSSCTSASYGACGTLTVSNTGGLNGSYSGIRVQGTGGGNTRLSNSVTVNINVPTGNPPTASYTYCRPNVVGAPYTVQFTDTSTDDVGLSAWDWDFGDASANSSLQSPSHTFPVAGGPGWWDSSWTRRVKITVDNSAQVSNLDNFPLLVTINSSSVDYGQTQDSGQDIRFIDSDGVTVLDYEIETWNELGDSLVWVRVPRIDGGSNTDSIFMYYGNSGATDNQNSAGVWSDSFAVVQHLQETPNDNNRGHNDSTANNNNAMPLNFQDGGGGSTNVSGQINGADRFAGDDDYLDVQNSGSSLNVGQSFTLEAWVKRNTTGIEHTMLTKRRGSSYSWKLSYENTGDIRFDITDGSTYQNVQGDRINDTNWHYVVARSDGSTLRVFNNGSINSNSTSKSVTIGYDNQELLVGAGAWGGSIVPDMNGIVDEVRVSSVSRSDDWIAAQYLSMTNAFIVFGPEETVSSGPYNVTLTVTDTDSQQDSDIQSVDPQNTVACSGNQVPTVPTLTGPVNGYRGVSYAFTANSTDPDNDQITYEFDWDNDGVSDASDGPVNSGVDGSASGSFTTLGTHCVRARAFDGADRSAWSSCSNIEMTNRDPFTPSNPDPADGSTSQPTAGDLSFSGGDQDGDFDTVTYTVTVYEEGTIFGLSPVIKNVAGGTNSITITNTELGGPFNAGKSYTWVVNADDGRGGTQTGAVWSFTAVDACTPASPDPLPPAWTCNADDTANVTWDWAPGIAGVSGYTIEIDDNADFSSPFDTQSLGGSTTNYTTSNIATPGTVYSRVRASFSSALEFNDTFTAGSNTELSAHTPDTGTGWTQIISVINNVEQGSMGGSTLRANNSDYLDDESSCGGNDGALYRINDSVSSSDYDVSVQYRNQDSNDDYSIIAARIQDANNMYAFQWSTTRGQLFKRVGGVWTQLGSTTPGINEPSTVILQVSGTTITAYDDGVALVSVTDASHSATGYAGVGMGAVITSNADCSSQQLDNFTVGVASSMCGSQSNWSPTATQPLSCGLVASYEYCRPDIAGNPNTVKFFNTSSGGATPYTFDWDFGDASLNTADPHPEHNFSSSIVAKYDFEDGSGTTLTDSSGNGNNGTLVNMEESDWVPGVSGTATKFDGVDEYIMIPHDPSFAIASGKIDFWFMLNSLDADQVLFSKDRNSFGPAGDQIYLAFNQDISGLAPAANLIEYRLQEYVGPTDSDGNSYYIYSDPSSPLTTNRWYHLEAWFGTGGMRMAIDGVMQTDTNAYTGGLVNNEEPIIIGASNLFNPITPIERYSSATIDNVMISDTDAGVSGGPYTVVLSVTDDLGQVETEQKTITPSTVRDCAYNLTSAVAQSCVTTSIGWDITPGADNYEIYRSADSGPYTLIDTIDAQIASGCGTNGCFTCNASVCTYDNNSGVNMLTRYDYYVNALRYDASMLRNSTISPSCAGSVAICPLGDNTPSCTPSGVVTSSPTCGQIRLDWNSGSSGVDGFNVYKGLSETGTFTKVSNGAAKAFDEQNGQVVFEAESFDANISRSGHTWIELSSPSGFSGSSFMGASPDSGSNINTDYDTNSPELQYTVNFTTAGTYYVWVRGIEPGNSSDSLHVGINGTAPSSGYRLGSSFSGWSWENDTMNSWVATIVVPNPGVHTINVWMREDGIGFDKMILTTDPGYTPSGTGPPESSQSAISSVTNYTDTDVLSGVEYYYYTTSVVDGVESAPSAITSGQTFCFRSPSFIER